MEVELEMMARVSNAVSWVYVIAISFFTSRLKVESLDASRKILVAIKEEGRP